MESAAGIGAAAFGSLFSGCHSPSQKLVSNEVLDPMVARSPHFPGKAKRVIYLHTQGLRVGP